MVVENVLVGPRIYSARESNMPIVEELRMEATGPDNVWFISARRSARSFCNGCRMTTVLQDRVLSQIAMCQLRSKSNTKTDTISFDPEHQNCILGFMAFSRGHTSGMLGVAMSKNHPISVADELSC